MTVSQSVARRALVAAIFVAGALPCSLVAQQRVAERSDARMVRVDAVVHGTDGKPIAHAEVFDSVGMRRVRTDERGAFRLTVPARTTLRVRALGFRAADVVADTASVVTLETLPTVLSTVTTTVGARDFRASESSRSVTIVDRKELDATASVAANQALRNIPGLQEIPAPPSKTSISIRGFDDSRVLVLMDGEPVAGSLIESRDIGRLSTLATERIEVTKGPSSVEFGSDAIGGVINLVQAAPTDALTMDAALRQGALGRRDGEAGISQTIGKVGYRLTGGWRQLDRLPGIGSEGTTFNRVYDVRGDVRIRFTDRLALRLNGFGSQERQRWPLDASFNGFIDNVSAQGFAELTWHTLGGVFRARSFEQRFDYQYRQSRGLLPVAGSADSLKQEESQHRSLLAYSRGIGAHAIDAGLQYSSRKIVSPQKVTGDSVGDDVVELFARDSWTIGPVLLSMGVRHSESSLWGSATNPSAGAAWQASSTLRLRTNVARGFRAPGFKDIRYTFSNPSAGYTVNGNPDLVPEHSVSSTVGATWAARSDLVFDAEVYRNDVRQMIESRYVGMNAAGLLEYRAVNIANARTSGIETSMRSAIGGIDMVVGYDWLRARDLESGMPLSRRATHTARVQLSEQWGALGGLMSDVSIRYTGSAPLVGVDANDQPAIVARQGELLSVDAQVRWNVRPFAELSVGGNNLLAQQPVGWSPAFARQWYAGLRVRWKGAE